MSSQLRDRLIEELTRLQLTPGDRIPSESEISERFGVGRSTAREALKLLEQEGVVVARKGQGRFLSSLHVLHVERPVTRFESVSSLLDALGYAATTTVLQLEERQATADERDALGLAAQDTVIHLERLRAQDRPLVFSVDVFPRTCVPGPLKHLDWSRSLTALLARHGCAPVSSTARLEAVNLPPDVGRRYDLENAGPWLLITETAVTAQGRPVLLARDYHWGEAFAFHVVRT